MLKQLLAHPLTRGLSLDNPLTTQLRRQIIHDKIFLRKVYQEWHAQIAAAVPKGTAPVLELGSGGGFLSEYIPDLITSEIISTPDVAVIADGLSLPFADASLRAIVMMNVFHHLPKPRLFFQEATRCIRSGGALVMIEPWVTPWSKIIYGKVHHEPFAPDAREWDFPSTGPLSGANGALPWILFKRDRARFEQEFPALRIQEIALQMPFRYLISGGVSMRSLMPGWTFGWWRGIETALQPWMPYLGMFARIRLIRA